ncbi:hypothetical protein EVAR_96353_1 [Eumeta japonica]|uniref:DUF4371 domain-containing protein n=1 Tax=Eumeta variegata TaxID=151549 RepID=A0A4C1VWB3_EUMVA|nr:hypothetical protein EVAR_96353_1 [Eumeta japonica]
MPPKYSQHYRTEWEKMLDFKDWLQPVENDTTKAYYLGDQEYSLLLDESTDISISKMLGVSIRYYSRSLKAIISTFLGLVEIEDGTANSIVNGIKGLLSVLEIEIKNDQYWH